MTLSVKQMLEAANAAVPKITPQKAREMMATLYRAMNILESGKFVQKIKYGCELQGTPVGNARAPLGELTEEEKKAFRAAMEPILNW